MQEATEQGKVTEATQPAATGNDQATTGTQASEQPKAMTQAEVDAIVRERVERERKKYADYGTLKEQAAKWAEAQEAQKTEAQKLADKLTKLEAENARLAQERQSAAIRYAVIAEAGKRGFVDPEDAYRFIDAAALAVGDDGKVTGADKALEALAKAKPYLLQPQGKMGASNPGFGGEAKESDAARRARLNGGGSPFGRGSGGGVIFPSE